MADISYYEQRLHKDLLEQFKEKPRIEALNRIVAKELQEVFDAFSQILTETTLDKAVGVNLDMIGSIVQLSRDQANSYLDDDEVLDDEKYRSLLKYKIAYNTGDGSYDSIIQCLRIIYGDELNTKIYETPDHPAAIILEFERFTGGLGSTFGKYPIPKAGGVGLRLHGRASYAATIYVGASFYRKQKAFFSGTSHAGDYTAWADEDGNILTDGNGDIFIE